MNEIVIAFIRWIVPFVCCGITGVFLAMLRKHRKENEAIKNGVKSLLRAEIIRQYEKYSDKGYCPIYAREPLTLAHDAYHSLGGNSTATDLFNKTINLPTEEDENG